MLNRNEIHQIEKIYFEWEGDDVEFKARPYASIYSLRNMEGGLTYISKAHKEFRPQCTILEFNIPEEERNKILASYKVQKGINGSVFTLCATAQVPFNELVNCQNYAGFWECSRKENAMIQNFFPCDPVLKQKFLNTLQVNDEVEDLQENHSCRLW